MVRYSSLGMFMCTYADLHSTIFNLNWLAYSNTVKAVPLAKLNA